MNQEEDWTKPLIRGVFLHATPEPLSLEECRTLSEVPGEDWEAVAWEKVDPEDPEAVRDALEAVKPMALTHPGSTMGLIVAMVALGHTAIVAPWDERDHLVRTLEERGA